MSNNTQLSYSNYNWKQQVQLERLRQAQWSYNLTLVATAATFCITLVGATGLMQNLFQEATVTTAVGLIGTAYSTQLCKDANNRLDKLLAEQNKECVTSDPE